MPVLRIPTWFKFCRTPLGLAATLLGVALPVAGDDDAFWTSHIEPLLRDQCGQCHSGTKTKSGLDLGSLQSILKGGDRGAAVIPGRPADSNLYTFLAAGADPHMPPKKQMSEEQVGLVKTWIEKLGAAQVKPGTESGKPGNEAGAVASKPARTPKPVWAPPATMPAPAVIDRFLEIGWKQRGVEASKPVDDAAFLRRVTLDLVGRIPTEDESRTFLAEPRRHRRQRAISRLLSSPEHARQLREVFDVVLMGRRGADFERQRTDNKWYDFLETGFRENRPWDRLVHELIVGRPSKAADRGAVWFLYERRNNAQAMAEAVAPVVFGVQIKCAQCHDHMVAREIKQAHYWGMVAAFNRTKNVDTDAGPGLAESAIGGFASFANLKKESQPAYLTFFNGRKVDEPWPKDGEKEVDAPEKYVVAPPKEKERAKAPAVPKFSRREALADAVTRDNPLLARAMVNRMWAMLMGRGMVHPVDLMDSKHPPSHPELLDWLARDFEKNGYDVRRLVSNIVSTRAYQLDSRATAASKPSRKSPRVTPESAPLGESFSRAVEKPLSAEQLFRSLLAATGNAADEKGKLAGRDEAELRRAFVKQFPDLFAAEYNASLQQALFLSNSPLFDTLLESRPGNLTSRLEAMAKNEDRVTVAFQAVYGRAPDAAELRESMAYLAAHPGTPGLKQLLWAMLTSSEFQVNH